MKKLIIITVTVILAFTIINFSLITAKSASGDIDAAPQSRTYIIGEYNGKVACFEKGTDEPFIITDVYIKYLPERDKELLRDGIELDDAKLLSRVLEDYRG